MQYTDGPVERLLRQEAQSGPGGFQHFGRLIREGIADGSFRADLEPELTLHAVMNAVVGGAATASVAGKPSRVGVWAADRQPIPRNNTCNPAWFARNLRSRLHGRSRAAATL